MIVYVYPADVQGCGYYRLIWPALALKAQGHDVRLKLPTERDGIGGDIDGVTGHLKAARVPEDADAVVMQRVSMHHLAAAVPLMRQAGVAVIVDMDDDLTAIDPNNPAFWAMRAEVGDRRHTWRNAHKACLDATLVTVSTPALLRTYAPHGRGLVLENCVPEAYLDIKHEDSNAVGWPGSTHSHPFDLQVTGPAVSRLLRDGTPYRGVGPVEGLRQALGLPDDPDVTGTVAMDAWPEALAGIGVGMAPLADTKFNQAKSWLKPLELSACGVPWVGSPRAEYATLHSLSHGTVGALADTPNDWYRKLRRLARDESLRVEQSQAGRALAAQWTIEGRAWRWAQAWAHAIELQRTLPVAS